MTLHEYVSSRTGDFPKNGSRGVQGGWMPIGTFDAPAGSLCVVDPMMLNAEDGVVVDVPPGAYVAEGRAMDFDGHIRVSRLRAYLQGTAPQLGEALDEVGTDSGSMAICDIRDVDRTVPEDLVDELAAALSDLSIDDGGEITLVTVRDVVLRFASSESGLGDGGYPVFVLRDGDRAVGVEVEFLPSDFVMGQD